MYSKCLGFKLRQYNTSTRVYFFYFSYCRGRWKPVQISLISSSEKWQSVKDLSLKRSGIHWYLLKTALIIGELIIDYRGIYFPWWWLFSRVITHTWGQVMLKLNFEPSQDGNNDPKHQVIPSSVTMKQVDILKKGLKNLQDQISDQKWHSRPT